MTPHRLSVRRVHRRTRALLIRPETDMHEAYQSNIIKMRSYLPPCIDRQTERMIQDICSDLGKIMSPPTRFWQAACSAQLLAIDCAYREGRSLVKYLRGWHIPGYRCRHKGPAICEAYLPQMWSKIGNAYPTRAIFFHACCSIDGGSPMRRSYASMGTAVDESYA